MSAARRPLKSLGQNFLVDRNIVDKIVSSAALVSGDIVLEVGPGRGALTEHLVNQSAQLLLVEYDHALAAELSIFYRENPRVKVVDGDILAVDLNALLGNGNRQWKVVANLPYNISTQVLFRFLDVRTRLSRMVLMLQKEVGDRLVASPGCADYGVTTVLLGLWFDIRREFVVAPGCFHPRPKVDSVVVSFVPLAFPRVEVGDEDTFRRVVKCAFAMRRKTLSNCLKRADLYAPDGFEAVLRCCGIDGKRRGETLSLEEFATLSRCLSGQTQ
jgi:16S rRNA (adenine1518-N6/adenine1519-N6)-dimethyltransferase